jgi:hypothetical protein
LEVWQEQMRAYVNAWNREAAALRAYQKAKEALETEQGAVRKQTDGALKSIVAEAGSFLLGGRLKYTPSGARGFLCVVASSNERALPSFTLPALTASGNVRLGRQVAVAGARLMPSAKQSTLPDLLEESKEQASSGGATGGLAGVTRALLSDSGAGGSGSGGGGGSSGGGGGGFSFLLGLWGTCLSLYTKGSKGMESAIQGLPWGLDAIVGPSLKKLAAKAQITAPDLRRPQPTLVNTADVGDAAAGGIEGALCSTLQQAKEVYERAGGANTTGLKAGLERALDEMNASFADQVERATTLRILGVSIPLPFADSIKSLCGKAIEAVRGKERELLAALGEGTL